MWVKLVLILSNFNVAWLPSIWDYHGATLNGSTWNVCGALEVDTGQISVGHLVAMGYSSWNTYASYKRERFHLLSGMFVIWWNSHTMITINYWDVTKQHRSLLPHFVLWRRLLKPCLNSILEAQILWSHFRMKQQQHSRTSEKLLFEFVLI